MAFEVVELYDLKKLYNDVTRNRLHKIMNSCQKQERNYDSFLNVFFKWFLKCDDK